MMTHQSTLRLFLKLAFGICLGFLFASSAQVLQAERSLSPQAVAPAAPDALAGQPNDAFGIAQAITRTTPTATPTIAGPQPTIRPSLSAVTNTLFSEAATAITISVGITTTPTVTQTPSATPITTSAPLTPTVGAPTAAPTPTPEASGPLEGTIIVNRTESAIRFFVEGQTYDLSPLRSQGLLLPRETAVLNMFNCDANEPQSQTGCFWDPYLLNRDGFYEIITGREAGKTVSLVLQEVGAPPANQIWVQNRIGADETLFFSNEEYTLLPSAVQEFAGQPELPITLYVRSCLEVATRTVCEWYPQTVETGIYYALTELTTAGAVPGSRMQIVQLQPVVGSTQTGPVVDTPPQLICNVVVPTLNVRSGPGLEFEIVAKIRGTETEPGSVLVIGRDVTNQWLAVDERVAPGGWITGSASFVNCTGDIASLPESEVTDGRLAATPATDTAAAAADLPTEAATPADNGEAAVVTEPAADATPTPGSITTIPEGQALLIVNNGFDQVMRFTLDQRHRVEIGASEFDMEPGQSFSILIYPGQVAFSASTPWRGLAGNADFFIDEKQSRVLWLTFIPDPDGSGGWLLEF